MEVLDIEEGEINGPGFGKGLLHSSKNITDWEDNKENNTNFSSDEHTKRRKLRDLEEGIPPSRSSSLDMYPSSKDSYIPAYKNRREWLLMLQERERKQRASFRSSASEERLFHENSDITPKTISDEHASTFDSMFDMAANTTLEETSQDRIVWPSWLDPSGSFSSAFSPLPEFHPYMQEKKMLKIKQREEWKAQLGDSYQPRNVSSLKQGIAVIVGDGWKRRSDGVRTPNIYWEFIKECQSPQDPRSLESL